MEKIALNVDLANLLVAVDSKRYKRFSKNVSGSVQYFANKQVKCPRPFCNDFCIMWALTSVMLTQCLVSGEFAALFRKRPGQGICSSGAV